MCRLISVCDICICHKVLNLFVQAVIVTLGAQLDAHPVGHQEVVDSMRIQLVIRRLRIRPLHCRQYSFVGIEIFFMVILSLKLSQEGQLSVSGKRMCTILVNHLGG